ncbi:hypothetical protein BDV93DRAFT_182805 [Ceratobasidium sp. AG-I]|nr:hypothetical protein BDV93DRAFT_182805 [Ceratobasidium sp. AG-I]
MPLDSNHPSSIRALQIPELAYIIFDIVGKQNAARLGSTCRELFRPFMSLAWEHVSDAAQILNLIHGASVDLDSKSEKKYITLPIVIGDEGFVRLGVYASFIKTLDIFQHEGREYTLLNWTSVLEHAEKRPLLPNLTSVRFANTWFDSYPQYVWMSLFISPALQNFQVTMMRKASSDTPPRVACALFKKLLRGCPDLRTLALFPDVTLEPHEDELSLLEGAPAGKLEPSPSFTSALREMSVSSAMFSVFAELGYPPFPALEYLSIYTTFGEVTDNAPLSQNTFPSLRHVSLFDLLYESVLHETWHALGPVADQLTCVELRFQARYWPGGTLFQRSYVLSGLVSFLAVHSPRITDLCLQIPSLSGELHSISGKDTASLLKILPLGRLSIIGTYINFSLSPGFELGEGFSQLKVLELPYHRIGTSTLYQLADTMPHLEYLSLDLKFDHDAEPSRRGVKNRSTSLRSLESNFQEPSFYGRRPAMSNFAPERYTSALGFARLLYSLWPNSQLITKVYPLWSECGDRATGGLAGSRQAVELINGQLSSLARLNENLESEYVSFESVDVMNQESWVECFV